MYVCSMYVSVCVCTYMCVYIINNEDTTEIVLVEVKLYAEYQQVKGFMLRIWVSQGFWGLGVRV